MHRAIEVRMSSGIGPTDPLCIYKLCDDNNVMVRFVDVSMEGMYQQGAKPKILIGSKRPVARRAFTCAHEYGHHEFGHGSTLDAADDQPVPDDKDIPQEVLVNAFAGFLMMPTLGLRHALAVRGIDPKTATPIQLYAVACNFNVGYATLVNHLTYGAQMMGRSKAMELLKVQPKTIRQVLVGREEKASLMLADAHWNSGTLDMEVGALVMVPRAAIIEGDCLAPRAMIGQMALFEARKVGVFRAYVPDSEWATYIRVSKRAYVGLAQYRHMEDPDAEQD
jgi:hypothetical protein